MSIKHELCFFERFLCSWFVLSVLFWSFVHILIFTGSSLEKVLCLLVNCFEHFLRKKRFSNWLFSTTTYNIQFCIHLHYIHSVSSVKDHSCNTQPKSYISLKMPPLGQNALPEPTWQIMNNWIHTTRITQNIQIYRKLSALFNTLVGLTVKVISTDAFWRGMFSDWIWRRGDLRHHAEVWGGNSRSQVLCMRKHAFHTCWVWGMEQSWDQHLQNAESGKVDREKIRFK